MGRASLLFCCVVLLGCHSSVAAITIDTVLVGDAGNASDPGTGGKYGAVASDFRIGTTEVTVGQYAAFLNAAAATDTYNLYNTAMGTNLSIAGISRAGVAGSYSYSVVGSPSHPITYVSWGDAARFANWLHNGQPGLNTTPVPQDASSTEDGAYSLNGATTSVQLSSVARSAGAQWFLPSENQWYKAAYFQPAPFGGDADNYWDYPTRSNDFPSSAPPPGSAAPTPANSANFYADDGIANGHDGGAAVTNSTVFDANQNYLNDGGAYTAASSFYGTYDQGGNVFEWNEAFGSTPSNRVVRGGAWNNVSTYLLSGVRLTFNGAETEAQEFGFRVAAVPEPSSALLAIIAGAICLVLGPRRRR